MNMTRAMTEKMIERIIKACAALREAVNTEGADLRSGLCLVLCTKVWQITATAKMQMLLTLFAAVDCQLPAGAIAH